MALSNYTGKLLEAFKNLVNPSPAQKLNKLNLKSLNGLDKKSKEAAAEKGGFTGKYGANVEVRALN
jgi:hypothetical protein